MVASTIKSSIIYYYNGNEYSLEKIIHCIIHKIHWFQRLSLLSDEIAPVRRFPFWFQVCCFFLDPNFLLFLQRVWVCFPFLLSYPIRRVVWVRISFLPISTFARVPLKSTTLIVTNIRGIFLFSSLWAIIGHIHWSFCILLLLGRRRRSPWMIYGLGRNFSSGVLCFFNWDIGKAKERLWFVFGVMVRRYWVVGSFREIRSLWIRFNFHQFRNQKTMIYSNCKGQSLFDRARVQLFFS